MEIKTMKKMLMWKSISCLTLAMSCLSVTAAAYEDKLACTVDDAWFAQPFAPKKSADEFSDASICNFHKFSWKTFLWLTEAEPNNKARFDSLYSDLGIYPTAVTGHHVLGGVHQAGSNGIMVDQHGRAIYTTMMINDLYRDFVMDHNLNTVAGMQSADPKLNFPNGAMSLKASWKVVQPGEDSRNFYTQVMPLQLLSVDDGQVVISDNAAIVNTKVALVGFHIAVYVEDHPEAIWATFEHKDNSPTFNQPQSPNKRVSDKNYTFYKAGSKAYDCNSNNSGENAILQLDETSQVMQNITQACLQYPTGTVKNEPSEEKAKENLFNINDLNKSVHSVMPASSVWQNYDEIGAVWFSKANNLNPNWTPNVDASFLIGSTKLSNTTIETFTQNEGSADECFACHNTMSVTDTPKNVPILAGKNINTSHILLKNYLNGSKVQR
jgi:hypothetical protein